MQEKDPWILAISGSNKKQAFVHDEIWEEKTSNTILLEVEKTVTPLTEETGWDGRRVWMKNKNLWFRKISFKEWADSSEKLARRQDERLAQDDRTEIEIKNNRLTKRTYRKNKKQRPRQGPE